MTLSEQAWDNQKLEELSEKLNRELPTTGGWILIDDGPDETFVVGDRLGYLRLGAALIEGATRPLGTINGIENSLNVGVDDLFGEWFVTFRCQEGRTAYEPWRNSSPRSNAAVTVGCGVVALGLLTLIVIGGYTLFTSF